MLECSSAHSTGWLLDAAAHTHGGPQASSTRPQCWCTLQGLPDAAESKYEAATCCRIDQVHIYTSSASAAAAPLRPCVRLPAATAQLLVAASLTCCRCILDQSRLWIPTRQQWSDARGAGGHVAEPPDDGRHACQVVRHNLVADPVNAHDLQHANSRCARYMQSETPAVGGLPSMGNPPTVLRSAREACAKVQYDKEPPPAPAIAPPHGRGWAPACGKPFKASNCSMLSPQQLQKGSSHLGASQLQVGTVHISAQQLVEGRVACQNDGLVSPLDAPAVHICSSQQHSVSGKVLQAGLSALCCSSNFITHGAKGEGPWRDLKHTQSC